MLRGAKVGALTFGFVGFVGGLTLCIGLRLPFPPIAITELALLVGGCLGALAGYASCFRAGRRALWGMLAGAILGLPAAGFLYGHLSLPTWAAWVGMMTLLGYQLGSQGGSSAPNPWKPARDL